MKWVKINFELKLEYRNLVTFILLTHADIICIGRYFLKPESAGKLTTLTLRIIVIFLLNDWLEIIPPTPR